MRANDVDPCDRLPVQVLAEYVINIPNRPEPHRTERYRIGQKAAKSASAECEEKIVAHLCHVAAEPGPDQIKFLEHIVRRLATDSSRVRKQAAALLHRTLRDESDMETESNLDLDLGDIIVKLDILKGPDTNEWHYFFAENRFHRKFVRRS